MKNIWKSISDFLFGKKDALPVECSKIYSELEKVKSISTKEENDKYPMDERVTSGYLRLEDDVAPEPGILTISSTSDKVMSIDINQNPPKISFFTPKDNEITLDEKKSDEIKKKRQYKKKKKK